MELEKVQKQGRDEKEKNTNLIQKGSGEKRQEEYVPYYCCMYH